MIDDGEHAPPGGSAGAVAVAAATGMLDDGERAPSGGVAGAGAAATGMQHFPSFSHTSHGYRLRRRRRERLCCCLLGWSSCCRAQVLLHAG